MSDKEVELIKEIIQSPHEFKYRYTSAQIVGWLSHQQQLIDQLQRELKHSQDNMIVAVSSIEYWQADAKRLDELSIRKQGLIDQQAKEIRYQKDLTLSFNQMYTEISLRESDKNAQIESLNSSLELAIKALEHYTDDTQYCGKCDSITYFSENGQIARDALEEIKRISAEGEQP
jgi:hypothetical protein